MAQNEPKRVKVRFVTSDSRSRCVLYWTTTCAPDGDIKAHVIGMSTWHELLDTCESYIRNELQ